ncbi:MAG: archaeal heat shock protein Hsp20 [Sulfolobales archaeon]
MRRRRDIFDWIDELFREIEEEMNEFIRRWEGYVPEEKISKDIKKKSYYYGFRITIGPDGVPRIETFGNRRPVVVEEGRPRRVISEEIEPLVDVYEEDDTITVVVEMPGVEKEKIKVRTEGKRLIIEGSNGKKYYREVDLPVEVDVKNAKATYKNGILEIKLKKKRVVEEGQEIKIE